MNTAIRRRYTAHAADALTAASLAYLLVTMGPDAVNGLPGLLVGLGVTLFIAHVVARLVTLRGAK